MLGSTSHYNATCAVVDFCAESRGQVATCRRVIVSLFVFCRGHGVFVITPGGLGQFHVGILRIVNVNNDPWAFLFMALFQSTGSLAIRVCVTDMVIYLSFLAPSPPSCCFRFDLCSCSCSVLFCSVIYIPILQKQEVKTRLLAFSGIPDEESLEKVKLRRTSNKARQRWPVDCDWGLSWDQSVYRRISTWSWLRPRSNAPLLLTRYPSTMCITHDPSTAARSARDDFFFASTCCLYIQDSKTLQDLG